MVVAMLSLTVAILALLVSIVFGIYNINTRIDTMGSYLNARIDALGSGLNTRIEKGLM